MSAFILAGLHGLPLTTSLAAEPQAVPGVPGFWDPRHRPEAPDFRATTIRFVSEGDFPPFNYLGADGNPTGFNVELARLLCEELKLACTIQMRRFDGVVQTLAEGRADAAVASIVPTVETRRALDFTDPYYRATGRFAARRSEPPAELVPERIAGRRLAVVKGSGHEAYLRAFFADAAITPYSDAQAARTALRDGSADFLFGDGLQLALWVNGSSSAECCALRGGAFVDSRFFGEGMGIAIARGNEPLRQALNWALFRVWETGRFADLWLRHFPVSPF